MATLGQFGEACVAHHTALIFDRGGTHRLLQVLDLTEVSWQRVMDKKTIASIKVTGKACSAQAAKLKTIKSRRHELVLFRGKERVWEGPVLQTNSTSNTFTLDASDAPLTYLEGTAMSVDWRNVANGGLDSIKTQRLSRILNYAMLNGYTMVTTDGTVNVPAWEAVSPKANIQPWFDIRHNPVPASATLTTVDTRAFQMTVGQHLYDLTSNGGIHFTTVGRRLVIWDAGLNLGRLRVVSERDFTGDFQVLEAGSDFATIDHVVSTSNSDTALPPPVGHGSVDFSYYGPWERVDPTSSAAGTSTTPDIGALNSQAKARVKSLYPMPLLLSAANGASLKAGPGLTMDKLIPGVLVPVVAAGNIRNVTQVQRLNSITVTESAQNGEKIATVLGPLDSAAVAA